VNKQKMQFIGLKRIVDRKMNIAEIQFRIVFNFAEAALIKQFHQPTGFLSLSRLLLNEMA